MQPRPFPIFAQQRSVIPHNAILTKITAAKSRHNLASFTPPAFCNRKEEEREFTVKYSF